MIRKFNVNVNGNSYYVELEEIKDGAAMAPIPSAPRPAAAPAPKPAAAPAAAEAPKAAAPSAGETTLEAPMPGTILDVLVKEGESVKEGQLALVLEAMKMENELQIPVDGVVKAVNVTKGASVNTSDVLIIIG